MLIALCHSMCSCSCQCSTTIMKRMKQATLFGFFALKYSLFTRSEWLLIITRMVCSSISESAQRISIMDTAHPRGVASHQIHSPPWISPCYFEVNSTGNSCTQTVSYPFLIPHAGRALVSCPPRTCLPARNDLVNEVKFLGFIPQNGGRLMRLRDC